MKITVKIASVEIIIDRPNMSDYDSNFDCNAIEWRKSLLEGTVIPMLSEAVKSAKELYLTGRNVQDDGKR